MVSWWVSADLIGVKQLKSPTPVCTDLTSGCACKQYGYRMSKVALNMAGVTLAGDLKEAEVSVALIHPGVVMTLKRHMYRNDPSICGCC